MSSIVGYLAGVVLLALSGAQGEAADRKIDHPQMAFIPAGIFEMGSRRSLMELDPADIFNTDRHALGPEDPAHEVDTDAFYIDIYEATNTDYNEFVKATGARPAAFADDPAFNGLRQPVVGISWKEAKKYCAWRGKRLPTEAEWEKGSRGKRRTLYPWKEGGPDGTKLNFNNEVKKTTPVGTYEAGKSDYGVYDLSGNVAEWVYDWHFPEYYLYSPKKNPQGPEKGKYKVIRGGNWRNNREDVRLTYRNATVPSMRSKTVGFRCVKDAN